MIDDKAMVKLAADIGKISPRPHHAALIEAANRYRSGCQFRLALSRGGWYRPGGVIDQNGTIVAENLENWAKEQLAECDDDMVEFVERHAASQLRVTRHTGRTHYFVATYGHAPQEFLQLEVEEVQEVLDRLLIDPDDVPEDMQELLEPIKPKLLESEAIGPSRYLFRRMIDMRQSAAKLSFAHGRGDGLPRFLLEWAHSSAASRGNFCNHWIVALREHLDRYRNPVISASLISCHSRELKQFQWNEELSGVDMSEQLRAFDRTAGYTAAWYFHLVSSNITPARIAYAVMRDLEAGFNYLPDTETALLRGWITSPYSI